MKFSEKLKKLRKDNNMTQDELAEKIFVSRTAISKWETDMGYPSLESLRLLSKVFGTTLDELVSDEDIENRKILDEKQSLKYYWIAFAWWLCAIAFVIAYSITKIKYLFIPEAIFVFMYLVFAVLSKPRYKREAIAKNKPLLIRYILIAVMLIGLMIYTLTTIY